MDYRIILINIFFLSHPNGGEVYDVTTIYRYGMSLDSKLGVPVINSSDITLEIHARTNAFGLPFLLHNKSYVEPNVGINIEPCTAFIEGCKWKKNSFVSTLTSSSDIPLSITGMKPTHHFWSKDNVTINLKFSRSFEVTVDTADDSGIFGIFLMDSNGDVKTSDMYYIYITNSQMGHSFLLKCDSSANTLLRLPSNYGKRKCEEMQRNKIELTRGYWKPYWYDSEGPYTFKVLYSEGHIQVTAKWSTREFELFKWQDPMPINVDFYSFGTVSYFMKAKLIIGGTAVLALTNKEGSLVSPTFVPNADSVCISVTYYRDPNSDLILYSVWPDGGKLRFEDMQTIPMIRGWLQTQFIVKLTDENKFNEMNVLLTAKANKHSEILIQRIAGCNSEGLEDVYISSNPVDYPMSSHGFDVAVFSNTSAIGGPIRCMNGGKFSKSRNGCICPAGFTGSTCVNGCGANMYGSNCEGHCSRTKRGCYGMKLCRPELECMCAPGLKGIYCDNPCQEGEYGVDCKEKCGHCKESLCDPYTGLCPMGCELGYHPPYCQENYHYLTAGPEATDIGFYNFRLSIYFSSEKQAGSGKSRFYQFQYKKIADYSWLEMEPRLIDSDKASLNISQLEPATTYQARVVLIDSDGNSYQGSKVAVSEVRTQCKVPANLQYNLRATKVSASGFQVLWDYIQEDPELCSMLFFEHEIKEYWGWVQYSQGKETFANFVDMLPGQLYHVRVRAFTVNGPILFSNIITVKTDDEAPSRVFDSEVLSVKSREIELKWSRPIITAGVIRGYLVIYQCQKLLACEGVDCSYSTGEVEVTSTSTVLKDLLPHAQYAIRVSALAGTWGPQTQVLALTDMSVPEISPEPNSLPVTDYTNSSFVVNWDPPKDCTKINGYMYGYHYMLLDSQSSRVSDGITQTTSAEFTNLLPYLTYTVKVFLYTSGGLSSNPLVIAARTKQPSPGPVEELTVYKRSRDLLGFRWAAPRILNGDVESFSVSYKEEGASQEAEILVIKPEPCVVWPQVYCHTFENLQPDTKYVITVQAKSTEMIEYGDPVAVTGITTESAPDAPSYIRILSQTQSNIAIEWGIPYMLNGLLRSFHVKVEETDSYNASDCCQHFPVHETIVRMEQSHYFIQYSRLRPASTYTVSVAAKTTALGPASTVRTYTRPPIPYMDMFVVNEKSGSISQNPTVTILPSANFQDLISGYLLLVLPASTEVTISNGTLWDNWLNREVRDVVKKRYFIAYELDSRALEGNSNIVLGTGSEEISGKWGVIHDAVLEVGKYYHLGLIVILEYQGLFSVGYTETDALKVVP